jgi:hypothetical protein
MMNRRTVRYLVSTERTGAVVLLRVDEAPAPVTPAAPPPSPGAPRT